jgi:putative toxin-antitoxin system antitoxin component (TIGR02293 family)
MATHYAPDMKINIKKFLGPDFDKIDNNPDDLRLAVLSGFPFSVFETLQKEIGLTQKQLSALLGISPQTISRRKQNNHFNTVESDILYRVALVFAYTVTVFGDIEKARVWLKRPNDGLGGEIPLNLLDTDIGSQQVEDELHRINYGIYS